MRKLLLLSILFTGIIFLFFDNCYGATKDQEHDRKEISDSCRKSAEEFFTGRFGSGIRDDDFGQRIDTYTNHYNEKLNKYLLRYGKGGTAKTGEVGEGELGSSDG